MKEKILTLIIGILIGAILATVGFIVYDNINDKKDEESTNTNNSEQFRGGNGQRPGNFSEDENAPSFENGEMPEIPDGEFNGEMPDGEPPTKPEGDNTTSGGMQQRGARPGQNNTTNSTSADA